MRRKVTFRCGNDIYEIYVSSIPRVGETVTLKECSRYKVKDVLYFYSIESTIEEVLVFLQDLI